MRLLAAAAFALVGFGTAASAQPAVNAETLCGVMVNRDGAVHTLNLPELRVLAPTAQAGRFAPRLPDGVVGILCGRTSLIPAPHDDEVATLGLPFYVLETVAPGRLGVLEISQSQYRFRMIQGALRPEEEAPLQARLDEFQTRLRIPN